MANAKQIDFLLSGLRHPLTDEPLAGGKVTTYTGGTTTPSNLFTARDTTEGDATNPVILDAYGKAEVYGNGVYKFVITDADDAPIAEFDMIEYVPVAASEVTGGDLDMAGDKIINLGAGTDPGDAVNYQQLLATETALQADIEVIEADLAAQKFTDLADTPASLTGQGGKLVQVNSGATALEFITKAGVTETGTFVGLTDTPSTLTGQGGKTVKVNSGGTALEFVTVVTGDVPVGSVVMYAGSGSLPSGWAACDGAEYATATYPALATALGGTWGTGVGTVKVPDFRGLFPKGAGTNANAILTAGGDHYAGAAVGQYVTDAMQNHDHNTGLNLYSGSTYRFGTGDFNSTPGTQGIKAPYNDSGLAPRTKDYTEPAHACIQFIIRIE